MSDEPDAPPPAPTPAAPRWVPAPAPRKSRFGLILALFVIAFVAGIAATIWGPPALKRWWTQAQTDVAPTSAPSAPSLATPENLSAAEARLSALSARLDDLSSRAQSAASYASRAEAMMVAFAARRALDSGAPLGFLEGELRVLFSEAQPRAVATIITAAREPVTLAGLQAGLNAAGPALVGSATATDWWTTAKNELRSLIVVHKNDAQPVAPQKALDNARTLLVTGRVDAAIAQVEKLPGHSVADGWLDMARRYNEAHRALDVIEAAAILEPRALPVAAAAREQALTSATPTLPAPTPMPVPAPAPATH